MSNPHDEQRHKLPLFASAEDAAYLLGISRSEVYRLINSKALRSCKSGRRRLICRSALEAYAARLTSETE